MVPSDANPARLPGRGEGFAAGLPLVLLAPAACVRGCSGLPHGHGAAMVARQRDRVEDYERRIIDVRHSATTARLDVKACGHF